MIANLITKVLVGIASTWLAEYFIDGVTTNGDIKTILFVGTIIGLLLFFLKPLLQVITLPLRIITLNLFTLVIIMTLIWITDILFPQSQFEVSGIISLFYFSLIVWGLEIITSFVKK
ncbi:MAG: phage holin family protein [Candidatus Pacebacteria bacterium]|nr:phage holin family protein [Candidatus Paceibacterota bacterium]